MPDPATHVLIPLTGIRVAEIATGRVFISAHMRSIFALGCIFPDLIDKAVPYTYDYLYRYVTGERSHFPTLEYLHSPLMLFLCIYIISFIFTVGYRTKVFMLISGGVSVHLLFDLVQGNLCSIGYLWFFPFSLNRPPVVTMFYDDQTIRLVPVFLAVFTVSEIICRIRNRRN